jgi:hypothetical protein
MGHPLNLIWRVLAVLVLIGGIASPALGDEIRIIYDPRPQADIPREARGAGSTPDPDAKIGAGSNITFGIVTDLKDCGPLRNVVPPDIQAVTVRHYDGSFRDIQAVQRFASGQKGRLLVWRQGRLFYQDPGLKWWFGYGR